MKYILLGLFFLTTTAYADCSTLQTQVTAFQTQNTAPEQTEINEIESKYYTLEQNQQTLENSQLAYFDAHTPVPSEVNCAGVGASCNIAYETYQADRQQILNTNTHILNGLEASQTSDISTLEASFTSFNTLQSQLNTCLAENAQTAVVPISVPAPVTIPILPTPVIVAPTIPVNVVVKAPEVTPLVKTNINVVTQPTIPIVSQNAIMPSVIQQQTSTPVKESLFTRIIDWFKRLF